MLQYNAKLVTDILVILKVLVETKILFFLVRSDCMTYTECQTYVFAIFDSMHTVNTVWSNKEAPEGLF